jgi:hypothetical protein
LTYGWSAVQSRDTHEFSYLFIGFVPVVRRIYLVSNYGVTEEQLDFIVKNDTKRRLGFRKNDSGAVLGPELEGTRR